MTESFPSRYSPPSAGLSVSPGYPVGYPIGYASRHIVAKVLRAASHVLARVAHELTAVDAPSESDFTTAGNVYACPQLEFYAEAGAAEGALYADGRLVGYLSGVSRL